MKTFLNNYLRDLILPNPSEIDRPFLPMAFTISETYEKFCQHYKTLNTEQNQMILEKEDDKPNPMSWSRF